ncbi:MAG: tRNA-dihydrouridine synthase family protein, partial [Candidatus Gastranaerophilales bacterium]|nr:tRNA-dihydrouridine synthase family protein [Candidatus Gastranaerophilales bacterium]
MKFSVIQSPLAGISDKIFRRLIRYYGAYETLLTTEMISSQAVKQAPNSNITGFEPEEHPLSFQISGHNPEIMAYAAQILEERASVIDINFGCPVNKIVKANDGSALMRDIPLAKKIVKAVRSSIKKPLSAKFRLGWSENEKNYIEFAKMLEGEGADFVTMHARTRAQMYSGAADWGEIAKLKKALKIPVFANGDIKTIEDIKKCIEITGANGVSIGRGFVGDFSFPSRAEEFFKTGKIIPEPSIYEKIQMLKKHLDDEMNYRGESSG